MPTDIDQLTPTPAAIEPPNITIPDFLDDEPFAENLEAPEMGDFTPRVYPGPVAFRFEPTVAMDRTTQQATPTGLSSVVVDGNTYPQLEFKGHIQLAEVAPERLVAPTDAKEAQVNFQRVSTYVFPKRGISMAGELYRSLGLAKKLGPPRNTGDMLKRLVASSGAIGHAQLEWEAYNTDTKERFTTARVGKKQAEKGVKSWPKDSAGKLLLQVTFSDGSTAYGNEKFASFHQK